MQHRIIIDARNTLEMAADLKFRFGHVPPF